MSPLRWFLFLLTLAAGLAAGLLYGWRISPVQYVDTTPDSLRADFRADYVLMVAEIYQSEQNPQTAARRLAALGPASPTQVCAETLQFAMQVGYDPRDIQLLQNLSLALQSLPTGDQP